MEGVLGILLEAIAITGLQGTGRDGRSRSRDRTVDPEPPRATLPDPPACRGAGRPDRRRPPAPAGSLQPGE